MPFSKAMPVSSVIGGLAVAGIFVAVVFLLKFLIREKTSVEQDTSSMRGDCIYQVFHGKKQLGTAFFIEPTRMSIILSTFNIPVPERFEKHDPVVPCDSALEVSQEHIDIPWWPASARAILTLGGKIDLNTAQEQDLMSVPGIGVGLARNIVEYRRRSGPFRSFEDLEKVTGVGRKNRKKFEEHLKIYEDPTDKSSP